MPWDNTVRMLREEEMNKLDKWERDGLAGPLTGKRIGKLVMRLPVANTEDYVYLELEENCGPCGGTGGPEHSCGLCHGTGIVANREGLILVELIWRYGFQR